MSSQRLRTICARCWFVVREQDLFGLINLADDLACDLRYAFYANADVQNPQPFVVRARLISRLRYDSLVCRRACLCARASSRPLRCTCHGSFALPQVLSTVYGKAPPLHLHQVNNKFSFCLFDFDAGDGNRYEVSNHTLDFAAATLFLRVALIPMSTPIP